MTDHRPQEAPIRRYLTVMRRRFWLLATFVVLVPAVAVGYSLTQSKLYQASSTVLISRQSIANQLSGSADVGLQQQSFQQVLVTQARLARTPTVLRDTVGRVGGQGVTVGSFRDESAVEADPTSDLLTFRVTRPDPASSMSLASAYAAAYVRYRRALDSAALNRALQDVNAALDKASRSDRAGTGGASLVSRLTTSRQQLETRLALQTANAQVVSTPDDASQVRPRPARSGFLGLIAGLVVGLVAAFLRDALDTRVRSGSDAEELLGTPVLSRVPRPRSGGAEGDGLAMIQEPSGAIAESFRILRSNLSFGLLANNAKVVMVTSSVQGEGKSTTIANLAVAYALSGKRVVIVDLDLRRPSLSRLFVSNGPGVTDVALGNVSLAEAVRKVDLHTIAGSGTQGERVGLDLVTSGALPPDPAEFVNSRPVIELLQTLRETYDLVLLDAPPLISVSDTSVIAAHADVAFICVRLGLVRRPMLLELRRSLERLSLPVLGQVVTSSERDDEGGYEAYYTYGASEVLGSGTRRTSARTSSE